MDAHKHVVVISAGTGIFEIMQEGVAGILGKGKPGFALPLADDPQASLGPVDIREAQIPDITGTQTKASEENNDGPIP
jgi:hypothetical protein